MIGTTVVFVHGFISGPDCWKPFLDRLSADTEVLAQGFSFLCYTYPTKFLQLDITRRIPDIDECGRGLGDFIENEAPEGSLMLVGHSMGGLVIQSYLASKIADQRAQDLERIRSVIMFATPNRGATILSTVRKLFSWLRENEQEKELQVLDKEVADTSDIIIRGLLDAKTVNQSCCPIPFRVFWGLEDDVVPEVSARGPFVEASPLPGGHSDILKPDPKDPRDQRYIALKNALLNPVGHPAIYEIARFEVNLSVMPADPNQTTTLRATNVPIEIHADNIAVRDVKLVFSKQNRCRIPYEQMYRSELGWVEVLSYDGVNEAAEETMSEYLSTGRRYTYLFTPDQDKTYCMKLRIYNGFGAEQRTWHNHMKQNARYKLFRFTLNLKAYHVAGYDFSIEPTLYFHPRKIMDHQLCTFREPADIVAPLPAPNNWLRSWEVPSVQGGVVDVVWDVKQPA
jgi:Alpha/beta hydrolase family